MQTQTVKFSRGYEKFKLVFPTRVTIPYEEIDMYPDF